MKYSKTKKAVAALALVLSGFGVAQISSSAGAAPGYGRPDTSPVKVDLSDLRCSLRCDK